MQVIVSDTVRVVKDDLTAATVEEPFCLLTSSATQSYNQPITAVLALATCILA